MLTDEPVETIHVYIVKEDEAQVVNSTLHETATSATQPLDKQAQPTHGHLVPYLLIAAHLLIVLFALFAELYLTLTETATITIMPKQAVLTERLTLTNVQSRIFQPVTLTQTKTVPATGTGHQDATVATGIITLYNAATQEQTIDAGTLLIGSDGVHVVTEEAATIPGAAPPLEGQTTVSAHAVNAGAAGNIHAGDIQGACCRENMFAYNSAFSGGQDERDFTVVTKHDIDSIVPSVAPLLLGQITTSFQKQLRQGETRTPNQCSQNVAPDHSAGDEAIQVTVTISESCIAGAYTTTDLTGKIHQALAQQAAHTAGNDYQLFAYRPTSPVHASIQQGRLVLAGSFQATMIYYFSAHELTTLRQQLAGKTRQQALNILSHVPGAAKITLSLASNQETLPKDPTGIHIFLRV